MADVVERLNVVHGKLLDLHKALIEWERGRYEAANGRVGSPYAMLDLLINNSQFAWLRRMSEVIVQIDEFASSKKPREEGEGEAILAQVRRLVGGEGDEEFKKNYGEAIGESEEIAGMHEGLRQVVGA